MKRAIDIITHSNFAFVRNAKLGVASHSFVWAGVAVAVACSIVACRSVLSGFEAFQPEGVGAVITTPLTDSRFCEVVRISDTACAAVHFAEDEKLVIEAFGDSLNRLWRHETGFSVTEEHSNASQFGLSFRRDRLYFTQSMSCDGAYISYLYNTPSVHSDSIVFHGELLDAATGDLVFEGEIATVPNGTARSGQRLCNVIFSPNHQKILLYYYDYSGAAERNVGRYAVAHLIVLHSDLSLMRREMISIPIHNLVSLDVYEENLYRSVFINDSGAVFQGYQTAPDAYGLFCYNSSNGASRTAPIARLDNAHPDEGFSYALIKNNGAGSLYVAAPHVDDDNIIKGVCWARCSEERFETLSQSVFSFSETFAIDNVNDTRLENFTLDNLVVDPVSGASAAILEYQAFGGGQKDVIAGLDVTRSKIYDNRHFLVLAFGASGDPLWHDLLRKEQAIPWWDVSYLVQPDNQRFKIVYYDYGNNTLYRRTYSFLQTESSFLQPALEFNSKYYQPRPLYLSTWLNNKTLIFPLWNRSSRELGLCKVVL